MTENKCPECGAPNEPNATECKYCGEKLVHQQTHQSNNTVDSNRIHQSDELQNHIKRLSDRPFVYILLSLPVIVIFLLFSSSFSRSKNTIADSIQESTIDNDNSPLADYEESSDLKNNISYKDGLNSSISAVDPSNFIGVWGRYGGLRYELAIEKNGNFYIVRSSGSSGWNSGFRAEMTCTFNNDRLEFNDGTLTSYRLGEDPKNDGEASIVEYSNEKGFLYLCAPEEVDSFYARFNDYYINCLAQEWDESGNPSGNGPYLLLIEEPVEALASSEYVIWYSSQIELSEDDVSFLSDADKRIAVNEIYARHGRKFNDSELQQHFNQCSWYTGTVDPASFNENVLSATEKYNIQLLAPANGQNVSAMKDPAGIYVEDGGVYMVTGDRDGPLTGYVEITNNIYGTYDVWVAESYKGSPNGSVETISANTPFYITSYYKGYSSTRALIFDGYDTITVTDEYQNVNVYHRITDDIKNHINYNY